MSQSSEPTEGNHLRPVPDGQPAEAEPEKPRRGSRLAVVLGVLLVVALIGWLVAWQDGQRLTSELAAREAALLGAQQRIEALEGRMGDARERTSGLLVEVSAIRDRLAELEGVLLGAPEAAPARP